MPSIRWRLSDPKFGSILSPVGIIICEEKYGTIFGYLRVLEGYQSLKMPDRMESPC
jgi:hypothetical protein